MTGELGISEIFENYFFSGYTVFNTLFYSFILIIMLWIIIKLFKKIDINPSTIIYSIIPFIFLGSSIRAFVDNNILQYNIFFITPGIYFIIGFLSILTLILSYFLYKKFKINYIYVILITGLILDLFPLIYFPSINYKIFLIIFSIWAIWCIICIILSKFINLLDNKINFSILLVHLFDATTTFVAVDFFNYTEQHVLPSAIYKFTSSAITMFPLKIFVIGLSLYLIDKYIDDAQVNGILKLAIFVLGLAPGLRNFLTMAIGIK